MKVSSESRPQPPHALAERSISLRNKCTRAVFSPTQKAGCTRCTATWKNRSGYVMMASVACYRPLSFSLILPVRARSKFRHSPFAHTCANLLHGGRVTKLNAKILSSAGLPQALQSSTSSIVQNTERPKGTRLLQSFTKRLCQHARLLECWHPNLEDVFLIIMRDDSMKAASRSRSQPARAAPLSRRQLQSLRQEGLLESARGGHFRHHISVPSALNLPPPQRINNFLLGDGQPPPSKEKELPVQKPKTSTRGA